MMPGPLGLPRPFPTTPNVETRATVPIQLLPWDGIVAHTARDKPLLVEAATRFPDGMNGVCPACHQPTTGVVSVGVQMHTATLALPYRGPADAVLEGRRPRSYRLEPCGCELEIR